MEDKIFNIVTDLLREDITKTEAIDKLLALYDVVGQSEQLVCDSYYANNLSLQKECLNCGKLSTEH